MFVIGNDSGSKDLKLLEENGITHVLISAKFLNKHFPTTFTYKQIDLLDFPSCNIKAHFQDAIDFIKKSEKVFVHCAAGVSRSASLVIAYLMQEENMTLREAFDYVKKRRSCISPNEGFQRQLREFEEELNSKKDPKQKLL